MIDLFNNKHGLQSPYKSLLGDKPSFLMTLLSPVHILVLGCHGVQAMNFMSGVVLCGVW